MTRQAPSAVNHVAVAAAAAALALAVPSAAAPPVLPTIAGYADLADLALAAPVVARVDIASASRLKPAEAPGLTDGMARFYVTAAVRALLRGASGVPAEVSYLVDVPLDQGGHAPKLRKAAAFLFAAPVAGRPGELRLVAPDAQIGATPEVEARLRAILTAAAAADAPPVVSGVAGAFSVPGAVAGEGETQIFLATAGGRPVSLTILRRPGEQPRWSVALSEMTDAGSPPPERDTLLWYRLACTLPPALPTASSASLADADAAAARADYAVVVAGLGPCGRQRARR